MTRPFLTKVWVGRHWRYVYTRRSYGFRSWRKLGVVSYKRRTEEVT